MLSKKKADICAHRDTFQTYLLISEELKVGGQGSGAALRGNFRTMAQSKCSQMCTFRNSVATPPVVSSLPKVRS